MKIPPLTVCILKEPIRRTRRRRCEIFKKVSAKRTSVEEISAGLSKLVLDTSKKTLRRTCLAQKIIAFSVANFVYNYACSSQSLRGLRVHPPLDKWAFELVKDYKPILKLTCGYFSGRIDFGQLTVFERFLISLDDFDYNGLMELTQQLFIELFENKDATAADHYKSKYCINGAKNAPVEIDFTPPFRKISVIEELEKAANLNIPKDFSSDLTNRYLADACTKWGINCLPSQTSAQLLENLIGHFLKQRCVNPTFLINYPKIMRPSAKCHRSKSGLTESFELVIYKHEFCDGHTMFADPVLDDGKSSNQLMDCESDHSNLMVLDEASNATQKYGFSPTCAWGLGMDRLTVMNIDWITFEKSVKKGRPLRSGKKAVRSVARSNF